MMGEVDLFNEKFHSEWKDPKDSLCVQQMSSRQSLRARFDAELLRGSESSRAASNWSDALSSFSNVNPKQVFRNGAEKLSQTINNVRTTFGTLSQKIKKSTKRRHPLINIDSPKSPVTPYTRSRAALGRTPTKLYSPFSIDTPKEKENITPRSTKANKSMKESKSKKRIKYNGSVSVSNGKGTKDEKLSNDLLQAQLGVYEFQSVANRIVQTEFKN